MQNPLTIRLNGNESETESAIINVLNVLTQEMYAGRVEQSQNDIIANKETLDFENTQVQADIIESVVDRYNAIIGG